jgi:hypothetical protein
MSKYRRIDTPYEGRADVSFGSKADILRGLRDVRFTPKSGHCRTTLGCPLSRSRQCSKSGLATSVYEI